VSVTLGNAALYAGIPNQRTPKGGEFGTPRPGGTHQGRDSVAPVGVAVYGSGSGSVVAVSRTDAIYGYRVDTRYRLIDGQTIVVRDGHLSQIAVTVGQEVNLHTVIGRSGGKPGTPGAGISNAPHLHEGVIVGGIVRDPDDYLNDRTLIPAGGNVKPITQKEQTMPFLTKDSSPTYFLITDLGMYVVPTQSLAESIDRVLHYTPSRADLDYYNSLVLGPRYIAGGTVPPAGGAPVEGTPTTFEFTGKATTL
jgi:hypothetical protein